MPTPIRSKVLAMLSLTSIQVLIGVSYKLSTRKGGYEYSPASAIAIAEFFKLVLSLLAFSKLALQGQDLAQHKSLISRLQALPHTFVGQIDKELVRALAGLALLYCINNQLTFVLMLWANPGNLNLFKTGATLITALFLVMFLQRQVTTMQWIGVVIQTMGLISVQWDECTQTSILDVNTYLLLLLSVSITALCSVYNEKLVKGHTASLPVQNAILYAFGFAFNMMMYVLSPTDDHGERGFLYGYNEMAIIVVLCNSFIGLAITAVYKYADAIIKNVAASITTDILMIINVLFFQTRFRASIAIGCINVFIGSYLYIASEARKELASSITASREGDEEKGLLRDADQRTK